jgi:hypothetical protein
MLAAVVPVFQIFRTDRSWEFLDGVGVIGFFGFATILSAWSIGPQCRHCVPTDLNIRRTQLWLEKFLVLVAAILCASAVACLTQTVLGTVKWSEFTVQDGVEPVLLLVILVCSAGCWTLVVRSVVGGILLTGAVLGLFYSLIVGVVTILDLMVPVKPGIVRLSHSPGVHAALRWTMIMFGMSYAVFMLWLSRRQFATIEPKSRTQAISV